MKESHSQSLYVTAKLPEGHPSMNYHAMSGYDATSIIQSMKGPMNLKNK